MTDIRSLARPSIKPLAAIAALAMTPLLAACAVAEARTAQGEEAAAESGAADEQRQCFFARQVNGFRSVEDEEGRRVDTHVLIDVGASDTYEFELLSRCPGLRFARSIALVRQGPGRICDGLDVDLVVQDDISPLRCPVTMVRKLDPDEEGARFAGRD